MREPKITYTNNVIKIYKCIDCRNNTVPTTELIDGARFELSMLAFVIRPGYSKVTINEISEIVSGYLYIKCCAATIQNEIRSYLITCT